MPSGPLYHRQDEADHYCISDSDILEELRKAANRNVHVRIRFDSRQQQKTLSSIFEEDRFRRIDVHPIIVSEDDRLLMHKKELIVDAEADGSETCFAVVGSYNPTTTARGNQESVFVLETPSMVQGMRERFDMDWEREEESRQRLLHLSLPVPVGPASSPCSSAGAEVASHIEIV
jgi:phosphatidylserine/phosphatidylglycerophosphate/cardiolipin synthase-like enzyme